MDGNISTFTKSAKDLSKNPLGIIALFIVMVYGFACLLFAFSAEILQANEKMPLIWFVIIFPFIVLGLFGWLVSKHHNKLYAPQDFRDDKSFLDAYHQSSTDTVKAIQESEKNISDIMETGKEFEIIAEQEKNIKADLTYRKVDYKGTTAELLIHSLAIAQINAWFERTYNIIYGSQISLLRKLSGFAEGIPYKNVETHFEEAKNNFPEYYKNWTLKQYLNYLVESKFVERKGNDLLITKRGTDFLGILSITGYSENKSL